MNGNDLAIPVSICTFALPCVARYPPTCPCSNNEGGFLTLLYAFMSATALAWQYYFAGCFFLCDFYTIPFFQPLAWLVVTDTGITSRGHFPARLGGDLGTNSANNVTGIGRGVFMGWPGDCPGFWLVFFRSFYSHGKVRTGPENKRGGDRETLRDGGCCVVLLSRSCLGRAVLSLPGSWK